MTTLSLPPDHPDRASLAGEVHARPPEALATPSRATYVAVVVDHAERADELVHLEQLCRSAGIAAPVAGASHFTISLGEVRMKWERHGEFSGYAFFTAGRSPAPFLDPPAAHLPAGWLETIPGRTIFAAHAQLVPAPADAAPDAAFLARHFGSDVVIGSAIGGGAGDAYTDFRIHDDGFARFLVLDRSFTDRQAGRVLQRLFEIEAYRMLSLLAFPLARELSQRLVAIERALADNIDGIARDGVDDEAILHELTRLAKEVEGCIVATQFRFGACAAYHELVKSRIDELREERRPGLQTIGEFMARRFSPAVATVASTSRRLHELAERSAQASMLLSTRVGVAREKQSQALLASMDRRARLQLRLQQTVESLSVAAILYYAAGLIGYLAKALKAGGMTTVEPDLVVGAAIVPLALLLVVGLGLVRRRVVERDAAESPPSRLTAGTSGPRPG